jgi:hypothetical protein
MAVESGDRGAAPSMWLAITSDGAGLLTAEDILPTPVEGTFSIAQATRIVDTGTGCFVVWPSLAER